jgi:hypothetical protein
MVHSDHPKCMSQHQIALLEHALREISKIGPVDRGWDGIPMNLRTSFARYMGVEPWTGLPDLMSLREAAVMIIRDAIARTGEFTDNVDCAVRLSASGGQQGT